jgi:hypothetical protein
MGLLATLVKKEAADKISSKLKIYQARMYLACWLVGLFALLGCFYLMGIYTDKDDAAAVVFLIVVILAGLSVAGIILAIVVNAFPPSKRRST